jgi:hypothetical protein
MVASSFLLILTQKIFGKGYRKELWMSVSYSRLYEKAMTNAVATYEERWIRKYACQI